MDKDRQLLRRVIDGSDQFMSGFSVGSARKYARKIPDWAKNDAEIRRILLLAFPNLATRPRSREAAGRWHRVIHLYFRLGYTYKQVAEEIGVSPKSIEDTLTRIYRVAKGLRANGTGERKGKRGRPKIGAV